MSAANVVAIYSTRPAAEEARRRLINHGIPEQYVRLSSSASRAPEDDAEMRPQASEPKDESFWGWLFGTGTSEAGTSDRLRGERTAVSVVTEESEIERVEDILVEMEPMDLREDTLDTTGTSVPPTGDTDSDPTARMEFTQATSIDDGRGGLPVDKRHRVHTRLLEQATERQTYRIVSPDGIVSDEVVVRTEADQRAETIRGRRHRTETGPETADEKRN